MMKLLYVATLFLAFSHLKDAVFLFVEWKNSTRLNDVVRTIDLLFIPLICAFFLEAAKPGMVSNRHVAFAVGLQSVFIVAFAVYPDPVIVMSALSFAFVLSLVTIGYVVVFTCRYHKFIVCNYSYNEHIDVTWVAVSCVVYFCSLFFYFVAFQDTTWLSESMYNVFSIVLWTFLFLFARRHRVVKLLIPTRKTESDSTDESPGGAPAEDNSHNQRDEMLKRKLNHALEHDKIYLNPKLALGDVAQAIGTNKTYLSDYFNNTLHTTFYDFINAYRVAEACRMIDAMPHEGRKSMAVVAEMSGFNSLSTFNRHFVKVMDDSPKHYYNKLKEHINQ